MYFLYSLVLSLLFVGLVPYFLLQAVRHGKYGPSFKQRMGWLPESVRGNDSRVIWLHAVSVGEFLAARTLIDRVSRELPGFRIVVSTTTHTGQTLARSHADQFAAFYFPFDWSFAVRRALDWVKPSIVIILETELWPNFLRECRRRGVTTVLANGRISSRSFRRYQKAKRFIGRVIGNLSLLIMQSEDDADRARRLGAPSNRVRVCGNLKYDQTGFVSNSSSSREEIDGRFRLSSSPHLIVAGSTSAGEEEILLASLGRVRNHNGLEDARLLIAPRHPERFHEVSRLIARSGFTFARRSQAPDATFPDVVLLDSIGELAALYTFAAVVVVGGSLAPHGGHNIIEPAAFAKAIVVGRHTDNFRQVVTDFLQADALVQIQVSQGDLAAALSNELIRLLSDRECATGMGQRALRMLLVNRGATDCTVSVIKQLMSLES